MYMLFDFLFVKPLLVLITYKISKAFIQNNEKNIGDIYKVFTLWIVVLLFPTSALLNNSKLDLSILNFLPYNYSYIVNTIITIFFMILDNLKLLNILGGIWGIGFLFFLIKNVYIYINFKKTLLRWAEPVYNKVVLDVFETLYKENKIRRKISLYQSKMIKSPLVLGIIHYRIILPTFSKKELAQKEKISFLIHHELVHAKRNDNFLKIIVGILRCIYWFCPTVDKIEKDLSLFLEMSCDSEVLKGHSNKSVRIYGQMILEIGMEETLNKQNYINNFSTSGLDIKKRIDALIYNKKVNKIKKTVTIFVMTILLCLVLQLMQQNGLLLTAYIENKDNVSIFDLSQSGNFDKELCKMNFMQYEPFGLKYHEEEDKLYLGTEEVRIFEDPGQKTAFWRCDGTIDVIIERNIKGEIVELKRCLVNETIAAK